MSNQSQKRQILKDLDEEAFRADVLVPLLKRMQRYEQVRERHGKTEFGKDITFRERSPLGDTYFAVVAKVGDISGSASGHKNLGAIQEQIDMAFDMPIEDVEDKQKYQVNHVIVWTTGNISNNAERRIIEAPANKFRHVSFKSGQATLDLLERFYPSFFTIRDPYIADYYASVKDLYSRIEELRTLGGSSEHRKLPIIFVPPTFSPFEPRRIDTISEKQQKVRQRITFQELSAASNNVVVTGEGGSGKSTLLRRTLLHIIEENEASSRRTPIPILVELKKVAILNEQGIEEALNQEFCRFNSTGLAGDLGHDLADGSLVILLDGLDELKTEERINQALERIREFNQKFPKTRIILTSRLLEFFNKPEILTTMLPGFQILQIEQLSSTQMVKFVEQWYGRDNPLGQRLLSVVNDPTALHGLPATPLTLALIAIIYESGEKELPANLTELFQKYIELALGRWDVSRAISLQFEWRIKEFILRKISWDMHQQRKLTIPSNEFELIVEKYGEERGLGLDGYEFTKEIIERSELLIVNGEDDYEHRSFQDFFVGAEINSRADALSIVANNFLDLWWTSSIFFAGGLRPESEDYLKAILESSKPIGQDMLMFAGSLGSLTQATYLAPRGTKLQAVSTTIDLFIEAWDDLARRVGRISNKTANLPHLFLTIGFHLFAQRSIGSTTLSPILSELVQSYFSDSTYNASSRDQAKREWYAFFLATACAQSGNIEDFIRLIESGVINDPVFLFVLQREAEEVASHTWIDAGSRSRVRAIADKFEKRVHRNRETLRQLLQHDPIPLPLPDSNV
jgi:hypothetical protein